MVLIEEMDMQRWFTVAYSTAFGGSCSLLN